jgi:hypothetical protein
MRATSLELLLSVVILAACTRSDPPRTSAPSSDPRTPLPLTEKMALHQKAAMRDHLAVVQEITNALATDDFAAIETSAGRIAWSSSQATMCEHLGQGAAGFASVGENFHRTASTIVESARRRDRVAVTRAVAATVATCVGCHATYRQEIVDATTFAALGTGDDGSAACPMHEQHSGH